MLTASQATEASTALHSAYVEAGGHVAVIPWADLIPILISIISGCIKPPTPKNLREAAATEALRPAVRAAAIEYGGFGWYRRNNGDAIAKAFGSYIPTASDELLMAAAE